MNYKEAMDYLLTANTKGSVYGLESITCLLNELDNPQNDLKFVHIAGTNGKGSTLTFISTILKEAGYKVGRYVSPTLICYEERIQINEEYIDSDSLARLTGLVAEAVKKIEKSKGFTPTAFEIETAIALLYFNENNVDIVTIETGLGGTDDATNVISTTIVSVIASISRDHMALLGDSIEEIAANKAGIIKAGVPVVSIMQVDAASRVILDTAKKLNCKLTIAKPQNRYDIIHAGINQGFSYKSSRGNVYEKIECGLIGSYQLDNCILAIETIEELKDLGYIISDENIYAGIKKSKLFGRFTKIKDEPLFFVDGAHNADASVKLKETLEIYFTNKRIIYIMGVLKDKEYAVILDNMLPLADMVFTITPPNPRALQAEELAKEIKARGVDACACQTISTAVQRAVELAGKDSVILSFGSLYYLGDVIKAVNELG